jgi:hypothetical protein
MRGWIGVDLDGTLAHYDGWKGKHHVGEPIPAMMDRVKEWITKGHTVKIFTARVAEPDSIPHIQAWLDKHGIGHLEITNVKDFAMEELWDDRAVAVEPNEGLPINPSRRGLHSVNKMQIAINTLNILKRELARCYNIDNAAFIKADKLDPKLGEYSRHLQTFAWACDEIDGTLQRLEK